MNKKTIEQVLADAYRSNEVSETIAVLSALEDFLESYAAESIPLKPITDLLFEGLEHSTNTEVTTWTLEALTGAAFHPEFQSLDLTRLIEFLEKNSNITDILDIGLQIIASAKDERSLKFASMFVEHPNVRVSGNAQDAIEEIKARRAALKI